MSVSSLMLDIAACICAAFDPDDTFCHCGLVPGSQTVHEITTCRDKCGQAWVRLMQAYPAVAPGVLADTGTCNTGLGVDIEIGVVRCFGLPNKIVPSQAQLESAALQQYEDMMLMRSTLACCEVIEDADYVLNAYSPVGPQGDVYGGVWTLSALVL